MYYELYIDVLFLVNFMMDYLLLLIVKRILKCSAAYGNICLGALTGSALSCLVVVLPLPAFIKFVLFHAAVNTAMLKIGLKVRGGKSFLKAWLMLYISGFLVGGVFEYLHQYIRAGSLFFALAVVCYYLASGALGLLTCALHTGEYKREVILYHGGREERANALLDTGNRLKDSVTGKAVSIIGRDIAGRLLGEDGVEGLRFIPYRSVGRREGVLPVVTLDKLCIISKKEKYWVEKPLIGISSEVSAGEEYEMILSPDI